MVRQINIYHLGGLTFTSKKDVKAYAQAILHNHQHGYRLTEAETAFFCDLLETHPHRDEKVGPGIVAINIGRDPNFNTPMFVATRVDGRRIDFSYNECLAPTNSLTKFSAACREAVSDDILAFRDKTFNGSDWVLCPLTGQMITRNEAHVDHAPPWPFSAIVCKFIDTYQIDATTIEMDPRNMTRDVFKDKALRELFRRFHAKFSRLRVISAAENIRLSNRAER